MLRTLEWQYSDNKAMIGSLAHPNSDECRLDSSSSILSVLASQLSVVSSACFSSVT